MSEYSDRDKERLRNVGEALIEQLYEETRDANESMDVLAWLLAAFVMNIVVEGGMPNEKVIDSICDSAKRSVRRAGQ